MSLRRDEWMVRDVPLSVCQGLCRDHHYAGGGSNTATFRHGLIRCDDPLSVHGVAWWIPPTRSAAEASWNGPWQQVLSLSRLVIVPEAPSNAASFLIGGSIDLIRRDGRWRCLVTYADEWQGHTGTIYRATNWEYMGPTTPEATFVDADGRMVARKAGPKTRTRSEMAALGYQEVGRFARHKFRRLIRPHQELTRPTLLAEGVVGNDPGIQSGSAGSTPALRSAQAVPTQPTEGEEGTG